MAERMQGGRLAARAIAAHGVDTVFTLSGGHVMPIYEGCRLEGVRVVDVRHEQAAAHAAEAWGRIRRACGVAVATAGPGVTGTVTAVANSYVAQTPLVVIGGARPLVQAEQGALQELDQVSLLQEAEASWWEEHRAEIESDASPIHHYRLGAELDRILDPDTVVIGDGGDIVAAVSRVLRVHRPGHWLDPGPFGCLGIGPPYALGVKTAAPTKQVVVVAGDGAFGLNGFELDTLARFDLPVVVVIGNDAGWGEIRIPQVGIYGAEAEVATRLAPTPYHRLPHVFGGHAEHVEQPGELAPALERALAAGEPAIVNVMLDPDAMSGHPYRGM